MPENKEEIFNTFQLKELTDEQLQALKVEICMEEENRGLAHYTYHFAVKPRKRKKAGESKK